MWILVLSACVRLLHAAPCEDSEYRRKIMWYFDKSEQTCFAYPMSCETQFKVEDEFYASEEECTLKKMPNSWKKFTMSCPYDTQLAVFRRSNGDFVPYIFSTSLCRKNNGIMKSDFCTLREYCYAHEHFAFCCSRKAFTGDEPGSGVFTLSGIGGPQKHLVDAAIFAPPVKPPVDCNTEGDRYALEWYPRTGVGCIARRSDCKTPAFSVDQVLDTYPTQQQCMDAYFANWRFTYTLKCMEGFAPVKVGDSPLIFSKSLCASAHHSDVCNRDERCAFQHKNTTFAFCCYRSPEASSMSYTIYGSKYVGSDVKKEPLLS
ncbi:unnamed protein product [Cylicocyclus nassatus]|uniref:Uncharacterized protein n=1 Tax=Cylicocyclus nassatus TaxID=53992 RepID=A0AA36GJE4_CYLNA|nr:unnamed protein product [Cylicocyclus nassatus]